MSSYSLPYVSCGAVKWLVAKLLKSILSEGAPPLSRSLRQGGDFEFLESLLPPAHGHGLSKTRIACQLRGFIGRFPREVGISSPEVPVRRRLAINRTAQIQRLNNPLR